MKVQIEDQRLQISGLKELDATNANWFRDRILAAFSEAHKSIDVDLSQTTLVDSCGLGALLSLQRKCDPLHTTVRLINPTSQILQLLELTRMHQVFEIVRPSETAP